MVDEFPIMLELCRTLYNASIHSCFSKLLSNEIRNLQTQFWSWRMGRFPMVGGIYITWMTCSRHNSSQLTGPNVVLASIQAVFQLREPFSSWYHVWENFTRAQPWPGWLFRVSLGLINRPWLLAGFANGVKSPRQTPFCTHTIIFEAAFFVWAVVLKKRLPVLFCPL